MRPKSHKSNHACTTDIKKVKGCVSLLGRMQRSPKKLTLTFCSECSSLPEGKTLCKVCPFTPGLPIKWTWRLVPNFMPQFFDSCFALVGINVDEICSLPELLNWFWPWGHFGVRQFAEHMRMILRVFQRFKWLKFLPHQKCLVGWVLDVGFCCQFSCPFELKLVLCACMNV